MNYGRALTVPGLATDFTSAVTRFAWALRYAMTSITTTVVNEALPGTGNGTASAAVLGVPGGIGGRNAIEFIPATSIITVANSSRWNALTDFTVVWIFNATASIAAGWRICQNVGDQWNFSPRLDGSIDYRVNRATVNATYTSAAGEISYPTGWMMLAMSYDETNGITAWKGQRGAVTQITSTGTPAAIGSGATVAPTGTLNLGNNGSLTRCMTGKVSFGGFSNPRLSQANLAALVKAAGI